MHSDTLSPKEGFGAFLTGKPLDRFLCVPLILNHAARVCGVKIGDHNRDGHIMGVCHANAWRKYRHDLIAIFSDTAVVAEAMGTELYFPEDDVPRVERLAVPALRGLLARLALARIPAILHICGDVKPVLPQLRVLASGLGRPLALSVDAMVSGRTLRDELPGAIRVGNVDAELLRRGPPEAIERAARRAAEEFHIVAPACGLVPSPPPDHLRALTGAVCSRR